MHTNTKRANNNLKQIKTQKQKNHFLAVTSAKTTLIFTQYVGII